jgi:glucose uptake protein GlcU
MSKMQTANQPALSRRAIRTRLLLTLIYAALVPYLIYRVATSRYHLSAVNALLLAALSPAIGTLIEFVRKRQMSVLTVICIRSGFWQNLPGPMEPRHSRALSPGGPLACGSPKSLPG